MAVTFNPPQQLSRTSWRLSWSSDLSPPVTFRVYRDGVLIATTQARTLDVTQPADGSGSPLYEVLDDPAIEPGEIIPDHIELFWRGSVDAAKYEVALKVQDDPDVYERKATVKDSGEGYFNWSSQPIEDGIPTYWRVTPISAAGNEGTPVYLAGRIVRTPSPPKASYSYSASTRKVTITLA